MFPLTYAVYKAFLLRENRGHETDGRTNNMNGRSDGRGHGVQPNAAPPRGRINNKLNRIYIAPHYRHFRETVKIANIEEKNIKHVVSNRFHTKIGVLMWN